MSHRKSTVLAFALAGTLSLTVVSVPAAFAADAGAFGRVNAAAPLHANADGFTIDADGVGAMVRLGVEGGRSTKPTMKMGVCGEHGGDPESIGFFHRAGLDYVSCSPFRVPVARLEAGRAAVING